MTQHQRPRSPALEALMKKDSFKLAARRSRERASCERMFEAAYDTAEGYGIVWEVMLWSLCGAVEVARAHPSWPVEEVLTRALTDALGGWDC